MVYINITTKHPDKLEGSLSFSLVWVASGSTNIDKAMEMEMFVG